MRALGVLLPLLALLAAAGCGGESESSEGTMIDWDLSQSHTVEDVDWPKPDLTAVELSPISSVSIELPEGTSFESDGDVIHDVTMDRRDRLVRGVQIDSHPRSRQAAYELAVRWARDWKLSQQPFDRWRAGETKTPVISAGRDQERIGPKGPYPSVEIRSSFNDERPALVSLQFFWSD